LKKRGPIEARLAANAPEPAKDKKDQRRAWPFRRIAALNALSRIESGQLSAAAGSRYWKPDTGEPDWVTIPAGEFWLGSDERDKEAVEDERPARRVALEEYQIARLPITNAQYAIFVAEAKIGAPEHWRGGQPPKGKEDHPVVSVSWREAQAYCRWLAEKIGRAVRLPTEAEWEKAARGDRDGRRYPWGDPWSELMCNSGQLGLGDTSPVGLFLSGASPYGVLDMAGNVWEWCQSKYKPYPYRADDGREDLQGDDSQVLRGGSCNDSRRNVRCAYRNGYLPGYRLDYIGFRVVVVSPGPRAARVAPEP
jgi:formylglycine-generating enzyme required for sulfatase activity